MDAVTVHGAERSGLRRYVSILEGIRPYQRGWLQTDIVAGITLAALAIPEVMGYTKIAGMPVITGLYTILIPIAAFALLGSSRHLVVGDCIGDGRRRAALLRGVTGQREVNTSRTCCDPSGCAVHPNERETDGPRPVRR